MSVLSGIESTDLASQRISIDPIDHIATVTATSADRIIKVYPRHVFQVFETIDDILIGQATPRAMDNC